LDRAGDTYKSKQKYKKGTKAPSNTPALIRKANGKDYSSFKKQIDGDMERFNKFLEKNGIPVGYDAPKIWILIDGSTHDSEGNSVPTGSWGGAPTGLPSSHRSLTIYPMAFTDFKGEALSEQISFTVGHEIGHSFLKVDEGTRQEFRQHKKVEAFGRWLNREAK
jgi:hypothetical protein